MTILVPFDDSALSRAALRRARTFGAALDADLLALTAIPTRNRQYAREQDWLDDSEPYDREKIVDRLRSSVVDIAPEASFEYEVIDRRAPPGVIASKIRRYARSADTDLVVIGSDNAGRIVTNVSSVGGAVATDSAYDVLIVRHDRQE